MTCKPGKKYLMVSSRVLGCALAQQSGPAPGSPVVGQHSCKALGVLVVVGGKGCGSTRCCALVARFRIEARLGSWSGSRAEGRSTAGQERRDEGQQPTGELEAGAPKGRRYVAP